jgi:hypothetical protein
MRRPVYTEVSGSDPDAWLERGGERFPLKRLVEEPLDSVGAPTVHPSVAGVESVRAALPDKQTRATIALVSETMAAVGPVMEAIGRLGPAARVGSLVTERYQPFHDLALPSLPPIPALSPMVEGPRALTADEHAELERVGLGVSSAAIERDARLISDFIPPFPLDL